MLALEKLIINGSCKDNYQKLTEDGTNFYFTLDCGLIEVLGISERENYPDDLPGGELDIDIDKMIALCRNEFFNNLESNRNNLACPLLNYIDYTIAIDMLADPPAAIISYSLYDNPLTYNPSEKILTGEVKVSGQSKSEVDIISVDTTTNLIVVDGNIAAKLNASDVLVIEGSQDNDGTYTVVSATNVVGNTEIIINESIPTNNVPLGELLYNNDSSADLLLKADDQLDAILWQLIYQASNAGSFYFSSDSGAYRFRIIGRSGEDIAESIEADFNDLLADEINTLPSGQVHITDSTSNDGDYTVVSAVATGADVEVTVGTALAADQAGGNVNIIETFAFTSNNIENAFKIADDLTGILFAGDLINISGSDSVDGDYTIFSVEFDGSETELIVEETIPAIDNTGSLSYSKSFTITQVIGTKVTFSGGYENKTVELFIEFIRDKFFSHEGLHVVEHVLLRPKILGPHFVDATAETLEEGLANNGSLYFNKTLPIYSASSSTNRFRVDGNISSELDVSSSTDISSEIYVSGTGVNDGSYIVKGVQYDIATDRTIIRTKEDIPADIPFSDPIGDIAYFKGAAITAVSSSAMSITIADPKSLEMVPGEIVEIRGSTDGINDGRFTVESVTDLGTHQDVVISQIESEIEDKLLDIVA